MALVIVGVLLLVAKLAEWGPAGEWSWWIIAAPFAAAVAWWSWSDASGLTQRRAMDKLDQRKKERRDRAVEALGMDPKRQRGSADARDGARKRAAEMAQGNAHDVEQDRKEPRM